MRKQPPCKGCYNRKLLCHGFCSEYQEWKKMLSAESEARQRENDRYSSPARPKKYMRMILRIK